jgi:hypothetical protein
MKRRKAALALPPSPVDFFGHLKWLDGRPLLATIEKYRRAILMAVLYTFSDDGSPVYNMALCGRAKKNWKTADLILAALYRFLAWPSAQGNDCFILANDEGQANDDLSLAKKLIACNPILAQEVDVRVKEIVRKDGKGSLQILPARDVAGSHGKTYLFIGYDEIHGYRTHDLFEALAPDPTRRDALTWITSYAGIRHAPGVPLYDLLTSAKRGEDKRLYFSWYAADFSTDPGYQDLPPEAKANPSMASWGNDGYLAQQKRRLPTHKYRRLHLNLPGAPDGAAFSGEHVMTAIVSGRKRVPPQAGVRYRAWCDMSGGSADDACLAIVHFDAGTKRVILDSLISQTGAPPFSPRDAVSKFCDELSAYGLRQVSGDAYAGQTFRQDFRARGITYQFNRLTSTQAYEALEPKLNAGEVELLDSPKLTEQLLTLVIKGSQITHQSGDHDDWACACAGAIFLASDPQAAIPIFGDIGQVTVTPRSDPVAGIVSSGSRNPATISATLSPYGGMGVGRFDNNSW